jgi:hypothetical protein
LTPEPFTFSPLIRLSRKNPQRLTKISNSPKALISSPAFSIFDRWLKFVKIICGCLTGKLQKISHHSGQLRGV